MNLSVMIGEQLVNTKVMEPHTTLQDEAEGPKEGLFVF